LINQSTLIITALFFIFIFLSGFWLKRSGKPYNGLKLNLHKFLSLGAAAYLIVLVIDINRTAGLLPIGIVFLTISALFFLVLIISGGLLSAVKETPLVLQFTHRMLPYLTAAATAGLLYFLL
jgi:hypothetical protein